jgi:hypothetical protein
MVLEASFRIGFFSLLAACCALIFAGCSSQKNEAADSERLLAKVHNKTLHLKDLDGMFPEGMTGRDSTLIINAYVNRWIRETLLLHEAERNIPKDLNIDKLVRDYRASLIRDHYERILVETGLDSTISQAELLDFYEKHKEQYQLETPIIRCYFIKTPANAPNLDNLRRWWNNPSGDNYQQLIAYCNVYAAAHHLEDSTWHKVDEVGMLLPSGVLSADNVSNKREITLREGDFQYFLRIFEVKNRKEIAPLGYIEDQARKVILHKRKIELLEEKKDHMYELALRRSNVELFLE